MTSGASLAATGTPSGETNRQLLLGFTSLPLSRAPDESEKYLTYSRTTAAKSPILYVINAPQKVNHPSSGEQYAFDFTLDKIINIIPKTRHIYLDFEIADYFAPNRIFINMAMRLYDAHGYVYIGELVRMREDQLFPYLRNNRDYICMLKHELALAGLSLNSKVAGWIRPDCRAII